MPTPIDDLADELLTSLAWVGGPHGEVLLMLLQRQGYSLIDARGDDARNEAFRGKVYPIDQILGVPTALTADDDRLFGAPW
jgi:hypothetical protein